MSGPASQRGNEGSQLGARHTLSCLCCAMRSGQFRHLEWGFSDILVHMYFHEDADGKVSGRAWRFLLDSSPAHVLQGFGNRNQYSHPKRP